MQNAVELISNLLWLAISSLLLCFWYLRLKRRSSRSSRTSLGVQIVALFLLTVILLPVISLTDDLQACTMPAESEHLSQRGDLLAVAGLNLDAVSGVMSTLTDCLASPQPPILACLAPPREAHLPCAEYLGIFGIRPPPTV